MKFSIKYFLGKYDQIRIFMQIWSHLRKKPLMENPSCLGETGIFKAKTLIRDFKHVLARIERVDTVFSTNEKLCQKCPYLSR